MQERSFRILNVFTVPGNRLSGNPLAVFEDGGGLSDSEMRGLARQFNLSETTFILPATTAGATARVRIFTPSIEMPFAGHPTLGTAAVVRDMKDAGAARVTLEMKVGLVDVTMDGATWTLKTARTPESRKPLASPAELAEMLGLPQDSIAAPPQWIDTGAEQLVIPLRSAEDVANARPQYELLVKRGFTERRGASMSYVWAHTGDESIVARFFFDANGSVREDPATGSACANLGGYLCLTGAKLPFRTRISQGDAIGRPSNLGLYVDADGAIYVSGEVMELGRGTIRL